MMRVILRVLDYLIPKDNKLILFGFNNTGYYGNAKSLFEYAISNSKLKPKAYTMDKGVFVNITKIHGEEYSLHLVSFRFIWYFCRAKTVVTQFGKWELYTLISKWSNKNIINLWHGTALKRLGYVFEESKKTEHLTFDPPVFDPLPFHLMPVASRIEGHTMRNIFRESAGKIIITGSPRNDDLITTSRLNHKKKMKLISEKFNLDYIPNHIILYVPTYRNYDSEPMWFNSEEFDRIMQECETHNAFLIFRVHRHYVADFNTTEENKHFCLAGSDVILDVQEILPLVTLLITDYSGIYFDYLLLDSPIIFFPYDLERYEREIGFLYPYDTYTPGSKSDNWSGIIDHIVEYFAGGDPFQKQRHIIAELMQEQREPIARQLILEEIGRMAGIK